MAGKSRPRGIATRRACPWSPPWPPRWLVPPPPSSWTPPVRSDSHHQARLLPLRLLLDGAWPDLGCLVRRAGSRRRGRVPVVLSVDPPRHPLQDTDDLLDMRHLNQMTLVPRLAALELPARLTTWLPGPGPAPPTWSSPCPSVVHR